MVTRREMLATSAAAIAGSAAFLKGLEAAPQDGRPGIRTIPPYPLCLLATITHLNGDALVDTIGSVSQEIISDEDEPACYSTNPENPQDFPLICDLWPSEVTTGNYRWNMMIRYDGTSNYQGTWSFQQVNPNNDPTLELYTQLNPLAGTGSAQVSEISTFFRRLKHGQRFDQRAVKAPPPPFVLATVDYYHHHHNRLKNPMSQLMKYDQASGKYVAERGSAGQESFPDLCACAPVKLRESLYNPDISTWELEIGLKSEVNPTLGYARPEIDVPAGTIKIEDGKLKKLLFSQRRQPSARVTGDYFSIHGLAHAKVVVPK